MCERRDGERGIYPYPQKKRKESVGIRLITLMECDNLCLNSALLLFISWPFDFQILQKTQFVITFSYPGYLITSTSYVPFIMTPAF